MLSFPEGSCGGSSKSLPYLLVCCEGYLPPPSCTKENNEKDTAFCLNTAPFQLYFDLHDSPKQNFRLEVQQRIRQVAAPLTLTPKRSFIVLFTLSTDDVFCERLGRAEARSNSNLCLRKTGTSETVRDSMQYGPVCNQGFKPSTCPRRCTRRQLDGSVSCGRHTVLALSGLWALDSFA